jgi:hypothetical protein
MLKTLMMTVALGTLAMAPVVAHANEMAAPAPAMAPAEAAKSAATEAAADAAVATKEAALKDGTKVEITGDDVVVVGKDGAKTPAPDATHELADGTKVTTKGGKIVHDDAAHEAH